VACGDKGDRNYTQRSFLRSFHTHCWWTAFLPKRHDGYTIEHFNLNSSSSHKTSESYFFLRYKTAHQKCASVRNVHKRAVCVPFNLRSTQCSMITTFPSFPLEAATSQEVVCMKNSYSVKTKFKHTIRDMQRQEMVLQNSDLSLAVDYCLTFIMNLQAVWINWETPSLLHETTHGCCCDYRAVPLSCFLTLLSGLYE